MKTQNRVGISGAQTYRHDFPSIALRMYARLPLPKRGTCRQVCLIGVKGKIPNQYRKIIHRTAVAEHMVGTRGFSAFSFSQVLGAKFPQTVSRSREYSRTSAPTAAMSLSSFSLEARVRNREGGEGGGRKRGRGIKTGRRKDDERQVPNDCTQLHCKQHALLT